MPRQYNCNACAFEVRSEYDEEVVAIVLEHAEEYHDMAMSEDDVRSRMREA